MEIRKSFKKGSINPDYDGPQKIDIDQTKLNVQIGHGGDIKYDISLENSDFFQTVHDFDPQEKQVKNYKEDLELAANYLSSNIAVTASAVTEPDIQVEESKCFSFSNGVKLILDNNHTLSGEAFQQVVQILKS